MVLKEPTYEERGILDTGVKWSMRMAIKMAYKYFGKIIESKKKGYNNRIIQVCFDKANEAITREYSGNETALLDLRRTIEIACAVADEPEEPKPGKLLQWAIDQELNCWHRGAKHLIWKRADFGSWNRPICEKIWEMAHETMIEVAGSEEVYNKDRLISFARQGLDSAMIIADADDPYFTAFKWAMVLIRDEPEFRELKKIESHPNRIFQGGVNLAVKVRDSGILDKLQMDWNTDISPMGRERLVDDNIVIDQAKREKQKKTRKYAPL